MMKVKDIQFILDKMDENQLRHANNTACISYAMGQAINCPPDELEALWFAGLLLESGKLCITNKLKNNIDTSFQDEFDILNRKEKYANYTLYTQALLKNIESLADQIDFSPASAIIDQAEENVDGTGYPRQLEAKEINTLSKVLRISAYYDNCRIQQHLSHEETINDLKSHADEYFPVKIIDPFIRAIEKNNLQDDYCEERNFTIGQLTEEEKREIQDLLPEDDELTEKQSVESKRKTKIK